MEVVPGERLGCFALGLGINDALSLLRRQFVPLRPRVDVIYSQARPLEHDIIVRVEDFGLQLRFDPNSQRLRLIELYEIGKVDVMYAGSLVKPILLDLYKQFGPTYPGTFERDFDQYVLRYTGLCLMFRLPDEVKDKYTETDELPLELPNGRSPPLTRLMVFRGFSETSPGTPDAVKPGAVAALTSSISPDMSLTSLSPWYPEKVLIKIAPGLSAPTTISFLTRQRQLAIGSSVQDIIAQLGQPSRIFFKEDNRMRIHSSTSPPAGRAGGPRTSHPPIAIAPQDRDPGTCFQATDYFYNYFTAGIDLLIDGHSHTLKKMIAHTNFPGHAEFSQYNKCDFRVVFPQQPANAKQDEEADLAAASSPRPPPDSAETAPVQALTETYIDPTMAWPKVELLLGECGRPMIHDSGLVANPFGANHLYAYAGCVFQVMRSGHIAGVTVF